MATPIVVPGLGESVTEATVAKWMKNVGDAVKVDEPLAELETDKVTQELYAPAAGTLGEITAPAGSVVAIGAVIGRITDGAAAAAAPAKPAPAAAPKPAAAAPQPAPAAAAPAAKPAAAEPLSPAVRKLVAENNVDPSAIAGTGKDGRLTKGDVTAHLAKPAAPQISPVTPAPQPAARPAPQPEAPHVPRALAANEERVPMTRLRRRIAERLKHAQNNAAMLTTFNEVDMGAVMALREHYKESFEKRHKVKLGFMGFFVKAAIQALKEIPAVNGEIDGTDIIYKNHYDIGVAVGTEQGLVVPVVRDADKMSLPQIEAKIGELGKRARDGKL
ncbi:MAG TPA: 2-oxo acid dehydrogenase subunit E2, partial [Dongiaceae bacterium]|nr:2-oxo acid dehydrogenase subunit E2 [Dongiaceae bacterium]